MTDNNQVFMFNDSSERKLEGVLQNNDNDILFHPIEGGQLGKPYTIKDASALKMIKMTATTKVPNFTFERGNEKIFITSLQIGSEPPVTNMKNLENAANSHSYTGGGRRQNTTRRGVTLKLATAHAVPMRVTKARKSGTQTTTTPRRRTPKSAS
jgi:hypothetical protein